MLELGSFFDPELYAPDADVPEIPKEPGKRRAVKWVGPSYHSPWQCGTPPQGYRPKTFFPGCEAGGDVGRPINRTRVLALVA